MGARRGRSDHAARSRRTGCSPRLGLRTLLAVRFLVVAPQTATNSLGRATSLMEVLHRIGDSHLAAYDTGPLWVGAEGTPFDVERFTSYEGLSALVRRQVGAGEHPLVIIAVKPFPRTLGWGAKLRNELGDATRLVADVDDADLPLQRAWRRREPPRVRVRRFLSENRVPPSIPRSTYGGHCGCRSPGQISCFSRRGLSASTSPAFADRRSACHTLVPGRTISRRRLASDFVLASSALRASTRDSTAFWLSSLLAPMSSCTCWRARRCRPGSPRRMESGS